MTDKLDIVAIRAQMEAMEGFTPGPWKTVQCIIHGQRIGGLWVEPDGPDSAGDPRLLLISGSGGARSYTREIVEAQLHDDNDANARLIAAAPEMRETILTLCAYVERLRAENERLCYVLDGVAGAIDTGRNEPLQIWRDQINIARAALGQEGDA